MIGRDGYVALVTKAYKLETLKLGDKPSERVVKDVEDAFRVLPPETAEFDHFFPSSFLIENPGILEGLPGYEDALNRFEQLFKTLNAFLKV